VPIESPAWTSFATLFTSLNACDARVVEAVDRPTREFLTRLEKIIIDIGNAKNLTAEDAAASAVSAAP
jgi:hypothetical protein